MQFLHFADKKKEEEVLLNGISEYNTYRGEGILIYPMLRIAFKSFEALPGPDLSIPEIWRPIATLGLQQNDKEITTFLIELDEGYFPIEVFLDVRHEIALRFAEKLEKRQDKEIIYAKNLDFLEVVKGIQSPRYVLEASFIIKTEEALSRLIEDFQAAGGSIWGAHSFDCFIKKTVPPNAIKTILL
jgi:hypothetical protein